MHDMPTLNEAEIAALLRVEPGTFRNNRRKLEADGFPRRLPHCRVWSKAQVLAWIDQREPAAGEGADAVASARDALDARLQGRAA
jgi:hypothetical protein